MPAPSFRFIIAMLSVILDGIITSKNMLRAGVIFRSGLVPLSILMNRIPSHQKTPLNSFGKQCLVFPLELEQSLSEQLLLFERIFYSLQALSTAASLSRANLANGSAFLNTPYPS
jgi:hypothetical protein